MIEDPDVYYSCSDCVLSFVKEASNGVYVEATTDHARCFTCGAKATFVCRVYPDEQAGSSEPDVRVPTTCSCEICKPKASLPDQAPAPKESCLICRYMTVTEDTLFKARKAIMRVFPSEDSAHAVINEFFNARLVILERI